MPDASTHIKSAPEGTITGEALHKCVSMWAGLWRGFCVDFIFSLYCSMAALMFAPVGSSCTLLICQMKLCLS